MKALKFLSFLAAIFLIITLKAYAVPILVDEFDEDPGQSFLTKVDKTDTKAGGMIGGFRTVFVDVTANTQNRNVSVDEIDSIMFVDLGSGVKANVTFTWDNNGTGLGGVDLIDGPPDNTRFSLLVTFAEKPMDFIFSVTDTLARLSTGTLSFGEVTGDPEIKFIDFANFTGTADFTAVNKISMLMKQPGDLPSWDVGIDFLESATPEPTTVILLGAGLVGMCWMGRRRSRKA